MYSNIIKIAETKEASTAHDPWNKICTEPQPSYNFNSTIALMFFISGTLYE
jgi:hypothetical protein